TIRAGARPVGQRLAPHYAAAGAVQQRAGGDEHPAGLVPADRGSASPRAHCRTAAARQRRAGRKQQVRRTAAAAGRQRSGRKVPRLHRVPHDAALLALAARAGRRAGPGLRRLATHVAERMDAPPVSLRRESAGQHRVRGRRPELPVLPQRRELRLALEPNADGAAHRPAAPAGPRAGSAHLQHGDEGHHRGIYRVAAARKAQYVPRRRRRLGGGAVAAEDETVVRAGHRRDCAGGGRRGGGAAAGRAGREAGGGAGRGQGGGRAGEDFVVRELVPAAGSAGTDPLNFAERVLQGLGARCVREGGLLRAELSPEQLAELEERPLWTLFLWQPHASNSVLLRLRAGADSGDDDDAEPLLPGSARLEQLCRFALRRGAVARAFLAPVTAEAPLRPYLALHFRVSYVGHDVRERLDSVAVDLVDGRAFPCPSLAELPLAADGAGCETE